MNKLKYLALIASIIANSACVATETTECVFDKNIFEESLYKNNQAIAKYIWSDKNKVAKGIFHNGNMFSVKHWSCDHYGTRAVLYIDSYTSKIPETLKNDILMLAKTAFQKNEVSILKKEIKSQSLSLSLSPYKLDILSKEYSEFYVSYSIINEMVIIEIKVYKG